MKYLHYFEGKNTLNWYGIILDSKTSFEDIAEKIYNAATNPNVEELKIIEVFSLSNGGLSERGKIILSCFYIHTTGTEAEKNFKEMFLQTDESIKIISDMSKSEGLGEYTNDEVYDWLEMYEMREDAKKYNIG